MGKGRLRLGVAAAAVLAGLTLAACGDDNGSSEDEDEITAAIDRAATSGDPAACTEVQTVKFVRQTSGEPGDSAEEALRSCQQEAADTVADEVDVSDIEVDGDTATAKAAVTGGFFDGQTLDIALLKAGDQWKLDEFEGFGDFDRNALIATITSQLPKEGATPQGVDCIVGQLEKTPDEQLEGLYTGSDPNAEERVFAPCSKYFRD